MANINVPVDGRAQFPMATVVMANVSLGRAPFAGVEPVGYGTDLYRVTGSWPKPAPSPISQTTSGPSFSGLTSSSAPAPRSMTPARALWPQLP
jgi:hypothetical protein